MSTVYEASGGAEGLRRLAGAWHARVMADEVVSHAFSHGFHPDHTERLADYWAEALGGPTNYSNSHGDETSVVRMHSGNGPVRPQASGCHRLRDDAVGRAVVGGRHVGVLDRGQIGD